MSDLLGYAIVDWDALYEVDDRGGPWREGKQFRKGALNYLRVPTVGTAARRIAMIARVAGDHAPTVTRWKASTSPTSSRRYARPTSPTTPAEFLMRLANIYTPKPEGGARSRMNRGF